MRLQKASLEGVSHDSRLHLVIDQFDDQEQIDAAADLVRQMEAADMAGLRNVLGRNWLAGLPGAFSPVLHFAVTAPTTADTGTAEPGLYWAAASEVTRNSWMISPASTPAFAR